MEWLRCIGGEFDGQVEKVDVDQVEVIKSRRVGVGMIGHRGLNDVSTTNLRVWYTRRAIHLPGGGKIEFLTPQAWTDEEALRHVLAP